MVPGLEGLPLSDRSWAGVDAVRAVLADGEWHERDALVGVFVAASGYSAKWAMQVLRKMAGVELRWSGSNRAKAQRR